MAELVDARDLKSLGPCDCESSILSLGTSNNKGFSISVLKPFLFGNHSNAYTVPDFIYNKKPDQSRSGLPSFVYQ